MVFDTKKPLSVEDIMKLQTDQYAKEVGQIAKYVHRIKAQAEQFAAKDGNTTVTVDDKVSVSEDVVITERSTQ